MVLQCLVVALLCSSIFEYVCVEITMMYVWYQYTWYGVSHYHQTYFPFIAFLLQLFNLLSCSGNYRQSFVAREEIERGKQLKAISILPIWSFWNLTVESLEYVKSKLSNFSSDNICVIICNSSMKGIRRSVVNSTDPTWSKNWNVTKSCSCSSDI